MIKLTYTEEMKKQDKLWEEEREDYSVMKSLYLQIIKEAESKGFKGKYTITRNNEAVIEVYESEEIKEKCDSGEMDSEFMFGFCKPLIRHLEKTLNKKGNMEIFINELAEDKKGDKNIMVFVCEDFEYRTGYDVYTTYSYVDIAEQPEYADYFELIARRVPTLEKAVHIAKVFAHNNNIVYGGDCSPEAVTTRKKAI